MTTIDRSRRLVAALVAMGVEVPGAWTHDGYYCAACGQYLEWREVTYQERHDGCGAPVTACEIPDLTEPENLVALLGLADAVGRTTLDFDHEHTCRIGGLNFCRHGYGPTRSLAIIAALEKAAGIEP